MVKINNIVDLEKVVIKFAGDSGDGMQLAGNQFTETSAIVGNDLATFPDFPAEIRAPQGTVAGVSGFQIHIGKIQINTPGDTADVLVAMNPAALKANKNYVKKGGSIILNIDSFTKRDLEKAGYQSSPLDDNSLESFNLIKAPITKLTRETLKNSNLNGKSIGRCKNIFALGVVYWMFNRPLDPTINFLEKKFKKNIDLSSANIKVLKAGYNFANTIEIFSSSYTVSSANLEKGTYRNIMGNQALSWGLLAAAENTQKKLFLGSYPITPASDILHELAKHKSFGVITFQAEDEIAGISSAIGASLAGDLAITTTSGPGLALKSEAIGLAVMTEIPIVVIDVQRGGPSTGLPTKTEQADLMQALYGRNGESPVIVLACSTPSNCFDWAYEASKLALENNTPVILLSDGYLANGAEPWKINSTKNLSKIKPYIATENKKYFPYKRNKKTLIRKMAIAGTKGLEHTLGGLEKEDITGFVSYDPENHEKMCFHRSEKIKKLANRLPSQEIFGEKSGDLLVVGWGGTYGSLYSAVETMKNENYKISLCHFNYINPLPINTKEIFKNYKKILVCELNSGQFVRYLRSKFEKISFKQYNKVQGQPFTTSELIKNFKKIINSNGAFNK